MILKMIAAVSAKNRVIGNNGALPWPEKIPADMSHFIRLTTGCPMIMGRKTLESFPSGPLTHRKHVVLSRNIANRQDSADVMFVSSATGALDVAQRLSGDSGVVWCIGGGEIYRRFLSHADELHLTLVEGEFEGDTYFPGVDANYWELVDERVLTKGDRENRSETTPYDLTFQVFKRKKLYRTFTKDI